MIKTGIKTDIGILRKVEYKDDVVYYVEFFNGKRKIKLSNKLIDILGVSLDSHLDIEGYWMWRVWDYFDDTDNGYRVVGFSSKPVEENN
jgi:hypothetical protein